MTKTGKAIGCINGAGAFEDLSAVGLAGQCDLSVVTQNAGGLRFKRIGAVKVEIPVVIPGPRYCHIGCSPHTFQYTFFLF